MPLYDRHCNECDEIFSVLCKIADKDLPKECPKCGATDGTYMIGAPMTSIRPDRLMTHRKDAGFGEVLDKLRERNPRTPLATGKNMTTQLSDNL